MPSPPHTATPALHHSPPQAQSPSGPRPLTLPPRHRGAPLQKGTAKQEVQRPPRLDIASACPTYTPASPDIIKAASSTSDKPFAASPSLGTGSAYSSANTSLDSSGPPPPAHAQAVPNTHTTTEATQLHTLIVADNPTRKRKRYSPSGQSLDRSHAAGSMSMRDTWSIASPPPSAHSRVKAKATRKGRAKHAPQTRAMTRPLVTPT